MTGKWIDIDDMLSVSPDLFTDGKQALSGHANAQPLPYTLNVDDMLPSMTAFFRGRKRTFRRKPREAYWYLPDRIREWINHPTLLGEE